MSRSKWKGAFLDFFLLKKNIYKKNIKIWSRRSTILSNMVGKRISVYNGQKFNHIVVTAEKVGFKFGEFSFTRNKNDLKKRKIWVKKRI